ncbi:hypothetical protein HY496_02830 [Candidatus Woesearchaeota archaeon]|nr:hypothetical protein [Candidatus Woesearchaeota archaeon]
MKKTWLLSVLLSLPFVAADLASTLGNAWDKILGIGSLDFLGISAGQGVVAMTRLLIWLLMFTVFFAVILGLGAGYNADPSKKGVAVFGFLSRTQAGVVAAVIATIAAIFLPPDVLLATGTGWATAVALLLIGGPIVGLAYLLYTIPGKGKDTKATVFVKFVLCLLLYWILSTMRHYVAQF